METPKQYESKLQHRCIDYVQLAAVLIVTSVSMAATLVVNDIKSKTATEKTPISASVKPGNQNTRISNPVIAAFLPEYLP